MFISWLQLCFCKSWLHPFFCADWVVFFYVFYYKNPQKSFETPLQILKNASLFYLSGGARACRNTGALAESSAIKSPSDVPNIEVQSTMSPWRARWAKTGKTESWDDRGGYVEWGSINKWKRNKSLSDKRGPRCDYNIFAFTARWGNTKLTSGVINEHDQEDIDYWM